MIYRTIIMSDLHLGSKACRSKDIIKFLENDNILDYKTYEVLKKEQKKLERNF